MNLIAVRALNSVFQKWGISANTSQWNISGEPCSGVAIDSSSLDDVSHNPTIKCDCSANSNSTCHITQLYVSFFYILMPFLLRITIFIYTQVKRLAFVFFLWFFLPNAHQWKDKEYNYNACVLWIYWIFPWNLGDRILKEKSWSNDKVTWSYIDWSRHPSVGRNSLHGHQWDVTIYSPLPPLSQIEGNCMKRKRKTISLKEVSLS